ncbi:hypothetical protein BJ684DRAFT_21338 [Piptocephalis cylindrospora]|uniref:Uncharacterized protein n=1 Tax=Piptocephalis cylindrospora TaxID=1907219 RepID=A0A4P9Y2Q7_9FUNG|nr:hypothetical protein BJ684DRAFT_21338 [Piptocephalis cylindrospora]|eukprot:RKP12100.1 hypothetical protein BJ684DRAFT_21338 [Piptocephalis cylindrospora]
MLHPIRFTLFLALLNLSVVITTAEEWGISAQGMAPRHPDPHMPPNHGPHPSQRVTGRPPKTPKSSGPSRGGEHKSAGVRRTRSGARVKKHRSSPSAPHHPSSPDRSSSSRRRLGAAAAGGALAGGVVGLGLSEAAHSSNGAGSPPAAGTPPGGAPPNGAPPGGATPATPVSSFAPVPPPTSPSGTPSTPSATPSPSPSSPVVVESAACPQALPDQLTLMAAWTGAMVVSYLSFF